MLKIMRDFLDAPKVEEGEAPQAVTGWTIKPTPQVRVGYLHEDGAVATTARWWFVPHWHKGEAGDWKATTFNAKVETAREKPTFRIAWTSGRCIIPAIGYYEWTGSKGKKQPWFIRPETNTDLFFFAGLMSRLPNGLRTCTILTRAADPEITALHPRMPIILRQAQCRDWLTAAVSDDEVIEDYGTGWQHQTHRVRPFGRDDDGPELIERDGFDL